MLMATQRIAQHMQTGLPMVTSADATSSFKEQSSKSNTKLNTGNVYTARGWSAFETWQ